jgi:solute carrier family 34 (sodium-dependent phosphate cotransporter)
MVARAERQAVNTRAALWRTVKIIVALYVFVGALQVMKTGASELSLFDSGSLLVQNALSTLGLGWLGALLVLSGSPVAATALTLVASAEETGRGISEIQGFTMLTGSRLGAAFVVLVTATIYAFRAGSGGRKVPISTAVICLATTALIYIPAAAIGLALLSWGPFHALDIRLPAGFIDLLDVLYGDVLAWLASYPAPLVFLGGLGLLLVAFRMIDAAIPSLEARVGEDARITWMKRKWPMFLLGCAVALVTMSVSVALTVLVPLVAKNYVFHKDILPYVMGANITTLGDTMLAAFALHSGAAVRIVLAEVIAATTVSLLLLAFAYPGLREGMWRFQRIFTKSAARASAFTAALFIIPITLTAITSLV